MTRSLFTLSTIALACCVLPAQAAIVNHTDVNGIRTFKDTSTGLVWADLDSFAAANQGQSLQAAITDPSYAAYMAALQSAGFTFAPTAVVETLKTSIDIGSWAQVAQFVNVALSDWGSIIESVRGYSDEGNGIWRLHAVNAPNTWIGSPLAANPTNIFAYTGLWAYIAEEPGGNEVPEPGGLALAALALAAATGARRSGRAAHLRSSVCNETCAS